MSVDGNITVCEHGVAAWDWRSCDPCRYWRKLEDIRSLHFSEVMMGHEVCHECIEVFPCKTVQVIDL